MSDSENRDDDLRGLIAAALREDEQKGTPPGAASSGGAAPPATPQGAGAEPGDKPPARQEPPEDRKPAAPPAAPPATPPGTPRGPGAEERKPGEGGEEGDEPPPLAAAGPGEAPKNWSEADRTMFDGLPPEAKTPFMQLYKRMEGGFTRNLQRGAYLEQEYGDVERQIFTRPMREFIAQRGFTVPGVVGMWGNTQLRLLSREAEIKNRELAALIHSYGGDPSAIATFLHELRGFAPAGGGDLPAGGAPRPNGAGGQNPELDRRVATIESERQQEREQRQREQDSRNNQIIENFANERDDSGNLLHPRYLEVEPIMAALANNADYWKQVGIVPKLSDLYEHALYAKPSTREEQLQAARAAATQQAADEQRQRAERARRAASSVTGAPGGPGESAIPDAELELRDTIVKNFNASVARSSGRGRV